MNKNAYNLNELSILLFNDMMKLNTEVNDYFSYIKEGTWNTHKQKEKLELVDKLEKLRYIENEYNICRQFICVADDYARRKDD